MHIGLFFATIISLSSLLQGASADYDHHILTSKRSSPFEVALENLQNQIGYKFQSKVLLRRAMTHTSFSGENNKALSILGEGVIETSVALSSLSQDAEISGKDLNLRIIDVSEVSACAADGLRLGLENIVRVSPKTNASMPSVVCGAFRAVFGAVAVDATMVDAASEVFWKMHDDGGLELRAS
ncbi:protein NUCLEAR FUSION DEFECTIVE 2 [Macadamia integrifolia]|uniref:protein NUCLEAR FUSION DEFECTIVE 2 n=1 Tax=Macadamia integrifolia TaxID=60698 RepID=UPI001C532ECA|nr:protein NUCLEAR FUSION DEFECTIVE 2 [Macadamia integrifolia]